MDENLLNILRSVDTPTVCNAIEVAQGKRGFDAFTRGTMLCSDPAGGAIVGFARTARIAAVAPPTEPADVIRARRMALTNGVMGLGLSGARSARAEQWRAALCKGDDLATIAARDGITEKYLGQMLCFAFLSPRLVRAILEGRQPPSLKTNWLRRHGLPMAWAAQDRIITQL